MKYEMKKNIIVLSFILYVYCKLLLDLLKVWVK